MPRTWRKARRRTAVCEFSGHRAAAAGPCRFKGGLGKNFFNNRGLITKTTGEGVPPENFGVTEWDDTDQGGRAFVTSRGGIPDVVGAEGPEAIGVDGGATELVAGMVEIAHADLAGMPRTVVVMEIW